MRLLLVLAALAAVAAALHVAMPASAASSPGYGAPSCLRGNWVATQGETRRVLGSLVGSGLFTSYGRLYMTFRGGAFQYGSTGLVLESSIGDVDDDRAGAVLQSGAVRRAAGPPRSPLRRVDDRVRADERDEGWAHLYGPGPPDQDDAEPGRLDALPVPGNTLKVRLPRIASLNWITLHRGSV